MPDDGLVNRQGPSVYRRCMQGKYAELFNGTRVLAALQIREMPKRILLQPRTICSNLFLCLKDNLRLSMHYKTRSKVDSLKLWKNERTETNSIAVCKRFTPPLHKLPLKSSSCNRYIKFNERKHSIQSLVKFCGSRCLKLLRERRSHGENVGQTLHSRLRKGLKIKIGINFMRSGGGGWWVRFLEV